MSTVNLANRISQVSCLPKRQLRVRCSFFGAGAISDGRLMGMASDHSFVGRSQSVMPPVGTSISEIP